jgi:hypothetical protein
MTDSTLTIGFQEYDLIDTKVQDVQVGQIVSTGKCVFEVDSKQSTLDREVILFCSSAPSDYVRMKADEIVKVAVAK